MGAAAGEFGSGIVAGAQGSAAFRAAVPKDAVSIGTVIAVQVSSCARVLDSSRV